MEYIDLISDLFQAIADEDFDLIYDCLDALQELADLQRKITTEEKDLVRALSDELEVLVN